MTVLISLRTLGRICSVVALVAGMSGALGATPQERVPDLPVSLDRVREKLAQPPAIKLDRPAGPAPIRFRTRIERPVQSISFDEWLHREFDLTGLARQSADWASRCCGIGLDPLFRSLSEARKRQRTEKVRQEIARELADLEAERRKAAVTPDR